MRRGQALEAAHVLRPATGAEAGAPRRPRHRSPAVLLAAVILLVSLAVWLGSSALLRP